ncbi:hypothetical protein NC651_024137 [Populus alba x Populus x berolinensis]|nr:hypothetical protein NC651_024137 [Populus alba x Populus x berolinensis]
MLVPGLCKAEDLEAAEESFDWMLKWQPHNALDLYGCFRNKVYGTFILGIIPASSQWLPIQLAEIPGAALFKIEPDNSGNHVLLSDINAAAGSWDHVAKVRAMTREKC